MRRWSRTIPVLAILMLAVGAAPALAQGTAKVGWQGWGVRVGASANPDQIYGGVHFNLGEFAPNVRFRPTIEMGFGDHHTLAQGLAEVHYVFSKVQVWKPYVGGGIGLTWDRDTDEDESDTAFSLAAVGGVETKLKSGNGFLMEVKLGLGDNDPDFKFGVGWSFK